MRLEDLTPFVRALFPTTTGFIEVRALPSKARTFVPTADPVPPLAAFLGAHARENCYLGAAVRARPGGTKADCAELWTLFVDLDFKQIPESEALARLARFPMAPQIVIHTGGGLHCYWLLREPLLLPEEEAMAEHLLRRLAADVRGDPTVAETARILRVPGTWNVKYTPPRLVEILTLDFQTRINVSELLDWLPPDPQRPADRPRVDPVKGEAIHEGVRNAVLYRLARALHARGVAAATIHAALHAENAARCAPRLSDQEIDEIARHAATQPDRADFVGPRPPRPPTPPRPGDARPGDADRGPRVEVPPEDAAPKTDAPPTSNTRPDDGAWIRDNRDRK